MPLPRKKMFGIVVSIAAAPFAVAAILAALFALVAMPSVIWKWTVVVLIGAIVWGAMSRAIYEIFFDWSER